MRIMCLIIYTYVYGETDKNSRDFEKSCPVIFTQSSRMNVVYTIIIYRMMLQRGQQ